MLTGGTEQTGGGNVDWRNRADWRGNVDWRNRVDWRGNVDWRNRFMYNKKERSHVLLPVLQILPLPPPPH